ncbi:MAG TPA: hypothetical protein PKC18_13860 [Lacipirellulaceae bacterium]|nr:hypothetical protein [Lacipirellulaceae bacterium]
MNELDLPVEASEDPYTGEPLLTKRTDQGWVVYAVGNNGVDEGGNFVDWWPDVGVGAPATPDEAEEAPEE